MSLWGMNEGVDVTSSGTRTVVWTAASNAVSGTSTEFEVDCRVGDVLEGLDNKLYRITSITSNTALNLDRAYEGGTGAQNDTSVACIQYPRNLKITQDDGTGHTVSSLSVFGIANSEIGVTDKVIHVAVADGGTGYANTDKVAATGGTSAMAGTITTDGDGVITAVTVTNGGDGFTSKPAVSITLGDGTSTGSGTGASLTAVMAGGITHGGWAEAKFGTGGKAGTVKWETLVAASSITGDTEDIVTPDN